MEHIKKEIPYLIMCIVFFFGGVLAGNIAPYKPQSEKQPIIIYKADNQGAEIFGKVLEKGRHGKLYTITIRDYGVFVVAKEVYENVKVGAEVKL